MEFLTQLVLAGGLAWASGIRLYAVVFAFGMLARFDYVSLPDSLALLEHDYVLWASGVMLVGEFFADKVPWFDSIWDAVHSFIRIPGGIALAWGALGDYGPAAQLAAALIGGTIVTGTHLTKSGTRALINQSPEPFSNWTASFAEDGIVLFGLWLMVAHPIVFAGLLLLFVLLAIWLLPKLWRALRTLWTRLARREGRPVASGAPQLPR
jgi:hypothetical protein